MSQSVDSAETIKKTVAEFEDLAPGVLPDVENWIGPEMFHQLKDTKRGQTEPVEFSYLWYRITFHPAGYVTVAR